MCLGAARAESERQARYAAALEQRLRQLDDTPEDDALDGAERGEAGEDKRQKRGSLTAA